ncbi:canalicular multispecific organic anion transporter 1 [Corynascus novoguineensis]|uniref:Canalicular multispecific organic anion transporter 1 n=1 Tax=Corynascus novoguineensis TaxID=1126955 RepID=A0AAN7HEN4_9PEZI|nr:canalicular multispecific organic anion transporter 1 [Corynascus novoguineensis]
MEFSRCPDDASFGPTVRGCRGDFDFTIKFEKIFFSIIPPPIFIALSLARIVYLTRKQTTVGGALLRITKLAAILIFSVLQLALLVLSSTKSRRFGAFFIPADVVTLLSGLCMLPLSYLEHSRSPRPSILLGAYLFVTILLDIAQTRTLWLASTNSDELAFSRIFTCGVAFKALIIILESHSKSRWIRWNVKEHSPEETTGLYGLGAYVWLNRLFLTGYRKVLRIDDLFPLDRGMTSETLHTKLSHHIDVSRFRGKNHGLALATAKALAVPLLLPVGPRIALSAFQFCQPFLIENLLDHLQKPADESSKNVGYGLIGAMALIYVGIAASDAFYWYFQERAMYTARGLLASAIYRKTTETQSTASDDSAALTLMSADIERIISGCLNLHEFWANTVEVAVACWLLSRQIGPASVAPLIVVGVCVVCSAFLARFTGPRQKLWMEKIQKRVGLTSNVIGQMKHLKISGLAEIVQDAIQSMRLDELRAGASFRTVIVIAATIGYSPLFLSPVIAFAFASRTLGVTTIFTSMSYIMLLAGPLGILFQMIPNLLAAFTCLNRIQAFLEKDPRSDFRSFSGFAGDEGSSRKENRLPNFGQLMAKVTITGGNFGWEAGKTNLQNINLEVPASSLTIVVGPVASGKSTLCKALLGEVPVFQGQVTVASASRKVGYCDQNPYLSNATIRENILGFAPFHQERYDEVIEATMLRPDLALLPQGDNTKIGSNGITLSGGQKQRVSMARALYLDTDLYIFDDILSGLDADTEEQVFFRVFSPTGLLRRRNATALLCTHSVRHLPLADHIVALGTDGTIVEQGTFHELRSNEKYVSALGVQEADRSSPEGSSTDTQHSPSERNLPKPVSGKPPVVPETAEQARMTGDWAVYRHYYARVNALHKIVLLVFSITWGGLGNAGAIWLSFWSEGVTATNHPHSNSFYNGVYAIFQVSALASLFVIAYVCFTSMITFSGARMHQEALSTMINAPLKFFTTTDTGVVVNLFSQDMTLVDGQLPQAVLNLLTSLFECLGVAVVVATSSPYVAITYPFLAMILYVLQRFYLRTSRQIRLLDLEAKSPLYSHFIDTIKGIATFRAFGWVQEGIHQNYRLLDTSQRPAYLLAMIQRWLALALQLVVAALAICVVALAIQLRSNTAFTGASLVVLMSFGEKLANIIRFYTMLETSIGAVSRLKAFSENVKPESKEGEDLVPPKEWPLHGGIEINSVSASYGNSDEEDGVKDLALDNLHLTIAPGEKVAICGRSGSGKSSFLLLLLRLLDPISTTTTSTSTPNEEEKEKHQPRPSPITIDGLPLHAISRPHLRQHVLALPQEPVFLPSGTPTQTNLDPHGAASAADCRAALEAVSLWPFIASRGGLEAPLAPDTLSQGQKQLFSLARAILRRRIRARQRAVEFGADYCLGGESGDGSAGDGGVLLLDEVSSSVDQETDEHMQRVIQDEFAAYTIVMVSHRLGMVMGFDRVVVMDAGRFVESGRPRELVETEGSRFRELWMVGNKGRESP